MQFHESFGLQLAAHGVRHIFGLIGEANMYLMDSFQRDGKGTYVSVAHEASAVLAASGYARVCGRLGVATVTHGPGLTNTVTALVESSRGRAPVLLIAGDTTATDRENQQNIPQRAIVEATGATFEQVYSPQTLAHDLSRAIRLAVSERRTVVLDIPSDFQRREVDGAQIEPIQLLEPQPVTPAEEALDRAAGVIASASRPIVLAGRGATGPAARAAVIALAERLGAPLATTYLAKDLFRDHPANLGIFGTLSHDLAAETISRCDTVIAFGASLNRYTTVERGYLKDKALVQVDLDPAVIGSYTPATVGVIGDAAVVANALTALLDEAGTPTSRFVDPELVTRLAAVAGAPYEDLSTDSTVDVRTVIRRLDEAFPRERTVIRDCGRAMYGVFADLHVPEPRANLGLLQFGAIGLGMGTALGASFADPDRPALFVCGDGGFMLGGLADFNTAVRHHADVVVVVMNDGAYGAEHIHFRQLDLDPAISTFQWPDFATVAEALGGRGYTVRSRADLEHVLRAVTERDRPVLIDVKLDPDAVAAARSH